MKLTYNGILLAFALALTWPALPAQLRVGDPGVVFDSTKLDPDYPQMRSWISAGVRGGIPFMDSLEIVRTLQATNSDGLNAAITNAANAGGGAILLSDGEYRIDKQVKMKSNVVLVGESRRGVICRIYMNSGSAFYFGEGVSMSGIYRLTIEGGWGRPKYDWNIGSDDNAELPDNENVSVKFVRSLDCWLDKVSIINSADFPMRCNANHTTFRDLVVDGCFNKHGGAHGYFFIQDSLNLITGCYITRLRHISIQGDGAGYNVVYDNYFEQEISFHSGDDGNNLIEQNRIVLPASMPGFNLPNYYAIMGPWSIQHTLSKHPNYLYKNQCLELNNGHNGATPWSDPDVVYYGPHYVRPDDPNINFTPLPEDMVPGGFTLYPVTGVTTGNTVRPDHPPTITIVLPDRYFYFEGDTVVVQVDASDDDTLVSVQLFLDGELIGTKATPPFTWGDETSELQNPGPGLHILKVVATDNALQTSQSEAVFELVDRDMPLTYTETFDKMNLVGWGQESFTGNYGFRWNLDCKGISGDIDGKGVYFHHGKTGIISDSIPGGISSFSVKCLNKWSKDTRRTVELIINDTVRGSMTRKGTAVYEFLVDSLNIPGKFVMAIKNASDPTTNNTVSFDNITWTSFTPATDTTTIDTATNILFPELLSDGSQDFLVYPNPFKISFTIEHDKRGYVEAQLYNLYGEQVFFRRFDEGTVHILKPSSSSLPSGMYILKLSTPGFSGSILIHKLTDHN